MNRWLLRCVPYLVLPLTVLLFAQWPLREWVQAGSLQANDLAQIVFALYVSCAVSAATRASLHLAAHTPWGFRPGGRGAAWALAACLLPWTVWLLYAASPPVWRSVLSWEHFPDSNNPGYCLIKLACWLLALLVLLDTVGALLGRRIST